MYSKILAFIFKLENNVTMGAIKKGFIITFPIILIGSISISLLRLPIPILTEFLVTWGSGILAKFLICIHDATIGLISAYLVLSISYYCAKDSKVKNPILHLLSMATSLIAFACAFGGATGSLTLGSFGPLGIFTAIISALVSTRLFLVLCSWKMHDHHFHSMGSDDNFKAALLAILPMFVCVAFFVIVNLLLTTFFSVNNFNELFTLGIVSIFKYVDNELMSGLLFTFLVNFLWIFGIHGGNVLAPVTIDIFWPAVSDPNAIISQSFLDVFAQIGGSGATLFLVIALVIASRSKNNRRLAYISSPMALFNINEILVFGLPIVFNPIMAIPFVIVPIVSLLIAYVATITGFMPIVNILVDWTTPIGFSGYVATQSFSGAIVQFIILVVGVLIYVPFIRLLERIQIDKKDSTLNKLVEEFQKTEKTNTGEPLLNRFDELGHMSKILVVQLKEDLAKQKFQMYYQPQIDDSNHVIGAEALLRWKYNGKMIYPPLAVALAREDDFLDLLTYNVLIKVCDNIKEIQRKTMKKIHVSANILACQLNDTAFIGKIIDLAKKHGVHKNLYLEVTEETSLQELLNIQSNIELLRENGILVAIDDFSMGQTSINYLKTNKFKYVKIDGQLIRQIVDNPRCCKIVSSLVLLGENLGYEVIAEYVENQQIKDLLVQLGCKVFQGHHFSSAIPKDEFIEYFKSSN